MEMEEEDPMALTGVVLSLPKEEADKAEEEMATCFVEEYLRMSYSEEKILWLFRDPFYQATHAVLKSRGEAYVRDLIRKVQESNEAERGGANG